ncbi:MAG TPA: molybdenum cofactor biosynthesis protein MoaE [Gemmatimonadaceae bacterium]
MRAALVTDPLDVSRLVREVASPERGATACFIGTVRETNDGRAVTGIDYRAYQEMAEAELNRILVEAVNQYDGIDVALEHRTGQLAVGDASIVVVVAHAHRAPALDALRSIVEQIKSRATIWKLELYEDGTREWVSAGAQHLVSSDRDA